MAKLQAAQRAATNNKNKRAVLRFYEYPEWTQSIRSHYWYLRYARSWDAARVRKEYRRIAREKKRLQDAGVDGELIRLYCRHIVNPRNKNAEQRWWDAHLKSLQGSLQGVS